MTDIKDFDCDFENKWCPGCGNFNILAAMKDALAGLGMPPESVLIVSGIGQAGKTPHFLKCNFIHGLHGRALPVATGAKLANHKLTVLVSSGDGDCYGEGGNHFLAAVRRNIDITLLTHDNKVYGLTKGQSSPTSDMGFVTRMQRKGVISEPFNPLSVALTLGAGFVARGFSGEKKHLAGLIQAAINHKGFSLVNILQPCVSFNHINTNGWYKKRVADIMDTGHDPSDWDAAMALSREWGDRIPTGILYQTEGTSFTDRIDHLKDGPLVDRQYDAEAVQTMLTGV
ncbi:MAG: 2-oxoacid:ferredoxin oxidoreductase subunit beta [Thermodesulfobacteriota bacterium]|nr:2-oxoacid:ferredoxin oxidoreductase subunit beta [Thermodesulfobacteriota bacterium]